MSDIDPPIKSLRSSLAFAAPEMHDLHWQRFAEQVEGVIEDRVADERRKVVEEAKAWLLDQARRPAIVSAKLDSFTASLAAGFGREFGEPDR